MQEYWERYMKPIEGYPAIVSFNAGVADNLPDRSMMYVGFVKVRLQYSKENGLIIPEERDDIECIEDRIEMESLRYRSGKYIGRIISQGVVHFIYYLKFDFEWPDTVTAVMQHFPDYSYESGSREDIGWEVYKKLLFPTLKEWQIIINHHACRRLEEQGDNLHVKRAIEHSVYFESTQERTLFSEKIEAEGFHIKKEIEAADDHGKCGLQFYRTDIPYYYDIDALTMQLIDVGVAYGGEYDGWECSLVKK